MNTESESNVRYVVEGAPRGWAAMAKTIREVDEDKVKDYKEDIDTLLVFTGLFSAIVTAFVIVSFPMLSPDKDDIANQHLAQISAQTGSYTITGNAINSTAPRPPPSNLPPPFKPSPAALRVNYLWFASLIITLITASFSMLVKQWLREYLAFEYTSPHERLRARQFRYPGLAVWKVYEIAGALPLLLQLAVGLFFLGLCSFTWSDLHGIGTLCAALVALWASLLVSATFAPIFSARCPYKTALLKHTMITLRHCLRNLLYPESLQNGLSAIFNLTSLGFASDPRLTARVARACSFLEEAHAIKQDLDEVSILKEVDVILLDDELLGTTILDSLTQSNVGPSEVIKFVLQAASLRLRGGELVQPLRAPPDLRQLTKRGWAAVSDIVAVTIRNGLQTEAAAPGGWTQDAICLLLAVSEQPLTLNARSAILCVLQGDTLPQLAHAFGALALLPTPAGRFHGLLETIPPRLHELLAQGDVEPADVVNFLVSFNASEMRSAPPPLPLRTIPDLRSLSQEVWKFNSDILGDMIEHSLSSNRGSQEIGSWLEDAVHILSSTSSHPPTATGSKALTSLCISDTHYQRFSRCIQPLAAHSGKEFLHVLSRLPHTTVTPSTERFFTEMVKCVGGNTLSQAEITTELFTSSLPTPFGRAHGLLAPLANRLAELLIRNEIDPFDVLALVMILFTAETQHAAPSLPLPTVLDLRSVSESVWHFSCNVLAATITHAIRLHLSEEPIGYWLEDAIHILLSPSPYALMPASITALARLSLPDAPRERLSCCIRSLAAPHHADFVHILPRLHQVCKAVTVPESVKWLLREIMFGVPCTTHCTHPAVVSPLALLLANHAPRHDEWTKQLSSILVERSRPILDVAATWPPGSTESLRALMSLPISAHAMNAEIPEVIFTVICDVKMSAGALRPLVSVDPVVRARIVPDAAIRCIVSLVGKAGTEGRQRFIHAMWDTCNDYLSDEMQTGYRQIGTINLVRHLALASTVHANIRLDTTLFDDWSSYYTYCAQALSVFRTTKYTALPDAEKVDTVRLVHRCLATLDGMEPAFASWDKWETNFHLDVSVFPDAVFRALVAFLPDVDEAARRCKRVRRLVKLGAVSEPKDSFEDAEETYPSLDHGRDGPTIVLRRATADLPAAQANETWERSTSAGSDDDLQSLASTLSSSSRTIGPDRAPFSAHKPEASAALTVECASLDSTVLEDDDGEVFPRSPSPGA